MRVIFLDNRDSFVYNLVDLTAREAGVQVVRNTPPVATLRDALEPPAEERAAGERPLLILSPGPGHPRQLHRPNVVVSVRGVYEPGRGLRKGKQAPVWGRLRPPAKFGRVHDKSRLILYRTKLPRPRQRPAQG